MQELQAEAVVFRAVMKLCSLDFEKFRDTDREHETTFAQLQWPKIAN